MTKEEEILQHKKIDLLKVIDQKLIGIIIQLYAIAALLLIILVVISLKK